MFILAKYIAEKLGPKSSAPAAATQDSTSTSSAGVEAGNSKPHAQRELVKDESCTDKITALVGILWNWSVIICMTVLPSQLPFNLLYLAMAISFSLALLVLAVEGYKHKQGLIKVYPKHIDVMLPIINLVLMVWLLISPPPSDWKRLLWFQAITNGCFFCFAVFSLVIKVPFTMQYAMEKVPEEFWGKPSFVMINDHVTMAWALMWGTNTTYNIVVSLTVPYSQLDSNSSTIYLCNQIIPLTLLVGAFKFTSWYPGYCRAKAAATRLQSTDNVALVGNSSESSSSNTA
jgi:hypothetical protein